MADVRKVIEKARENIKASQQLSFKKEKRAKRTTLFIDEIHRFNKAQQDALLGAVEKGSIKLIGATTENPSFEVNNALLSRCQVYVLEPLSVEELRILLETAIKSDSVLSQRNIVTEETDALFAFSVGDARKMRNLLVLWMV